MPAVINLDFADVQTVMRDKGIAHIGIGEVKATIRLSWQSKASKGPLLETTIAGATDIIINVSGDISMFDASDAVDYVRESPAMTLTSSSVPCMIQPGRLLPDYRNCNRY